MLLKKSNKEHSLLKMTSYENEEVKHEFILDKKKMLIGSYENCDIFLDDQYVSHYHALVIVDDNNQPKIIDLESSNGIFIKDEKIKESHFTVGDIIRIGKRDFYIEEIIEEKEVADQDHQKVVLVNEEEIKESIPELPPVDGLTFIDGEYCDITFQENNFTPLTYMPVDSSSDYSDYVDTVENEKIEEIAHATEQKAIEISILSMGNILSLEYLPIKSKTYFLSSKRKKRNTLHFEFADLSKDVPFIKIKDNNVEVFPIPNFQFNKLEGHGNEPLPSDNSVCLKEDDIICFNHQSVQVMVRLVNAPPELKATPFFQNDRAFNIQTGKVFGTLMSLMLLLLLVNIEDVKKEPEKKVTVIYKRAIRSNVQTENKSPRPNKEEIGSKELEQPKKEVTMAKKGTPKKIKKKIIPKKSLARKPKAKAPKKKVVKAPKVKAYEFKMKNSLTSLFSPTKSLNNVKINKTAHAATSNNGPELTHANSTGSLKSKLNMNVGNLGKDYKGNADRSYGVKGLGGKRGIETTYIEPKTVVLGSMDPELLRKILREYLPQFRHCYQQELQEHSEKVQGVVDLNFRIEKNGNVSNINIRTKKSRFSNKGTKCMANVLKIIDFPKPKGGGVVDVRQPLNFYSEKGKMI